MFLLARPSLQVCGCHRDKKVKTSSPVMVMTSLPLASLQKGCAYTNMLNQPWPFPSLDTSHVSSSRVIWDHRRGAGWSPLFAAGKRAPEFASLNFLTTLWTDGKGWHLNRWDWPSQNSLSWEIVSEGQDAHHKKHQPSAVTGQWQDPSSVLHRVMLAAVPLCATCELASCLWPAVFPKKCGVLVVGYFFTFFFSFSFFFFFFFPT